MLDEIKSVSGAEFTETQCVAAFALYGGVVGAIAGEFGSAATAGIFSGAGRTGGLSGRSFAGGVVGGLFCAPILSGQEIDGLSRLRYESQRGVYLHPTYSVTHERTALGVMDAWMWARK